MSLRVNFCGLPFSTPIVMLSGSNGFGNTYTRIEGFSYQDVGAVFLNGTTLQPRGGYPPHRLAETALGLLSATGWPNPGVDAVVNTILPAFATEVTHICANVCGFTIEEYVEVTRRFDDTSVAAIELNLSCPRDQADGNIFDDDLEHSARIVAACRAVTTKPLITKLSAHHADIRAMARRCIDAGTSALSLINTVPGAAINIESRRSVLGQLSAGLSGAAIKPIAILNVMQVAEIARPYGVAVIGQGGVRTPEDAIEFMIAGADVVGVCTGLYYDPLVCTKINAGIAAYLARHHLSGVAQLTGSLHRQG